MNGSESERQTNKKGKPMAADCARCEGMRICSPYNFQNEENRRLIALATRPESL
jgi:hypothetical protein